MPMNQDLVGKAYPPVPFSVSPERVGAFAAAVGERDSVVPPTIASIPEVVSLSYAIGDRDLGLDYSRVVHADQEYEWDRPLRMGDELIVITTIASIRAKGGHEWLVLESDVRDGGGERVVLARSTLIVRGIA